MYAAAGGASLAGRKARLTRPTAPSQASSHTAPPHPVRAYSCSHWEALVRQPPPTSSLPPHPIAPHNNHYDHQHLPFGCECAQGRAAWQEAAVTYTGGGAIGAGGAARRCSVPGTHHSRNATGGAGNKWNNKSRVRDTHYGSGSDSECESDWGDEDDGEPAGAATLLYAGLGTLALGLVVYFVGTGDKGFRTPALRMVGPSLIAGGLACCLLRLLLCAISKPCCQCKKNRKERSSPVMGEELPLAERRSPRPRLGPLQCSPARRPPASSSSLDLASLSSSEEEERLRRYRITPRERPSREQPSPKELPPKHPPPQLPPPQPPPMHPSALRQNAPQAWEKTQERRGVSFSPPPTGEIVLSPSQLRP